VDEAKPFDIPKREVWEAFKKVKANQGAAGADGQSIADFEADLSNNLYKLWNRLSFAIGDLLRIVTCPDGRQRRKRDQIANATTQLLGVSKRLDPWHDQQPCLASVPRILVTDKLFSGRRG